MKSEWDLPCRKCDAKKGNTVHCKECAGKAYHKFEYPYQKAKRRKKK